MGTRRQPLTIVELWLRAQDLTVERPQLHPHLAVRRGDGREERASTTRSSARRRKPSVVECAKKARSTATSEPAGSAPTGKGRAPFLVRIGADQTSTAPAAKSAS